MPVVAKAIGTRPVRARPGPCRLLPGKPGELRSFPRTRGCGPSPVSRRRYPGTPVATTEPVADYMLEAAGARNETPWALQADIMNGVDPAPQDITAEDGLFTGHKVKVFLYNEQVTDSITQSFLGLRKKSGIPVVGVYETMPEPGYDYQTWMLAEVHALDKAVADKVSTEHL